MQLTNFLLPLLFAVSGAQAQPDDVTSVMTYYTTFTVSRVVETTTCTSTTTPPAAPTTTQAAIVSSSQAPVSSPSTSITTELITQTVQRVAASQVLSSSSSSMVTVASASAGIPHASNGTSVTAAMPTVTHYTGAASGLTVQFGAAAVIAAVAGVAQLL